MSFVALSVSTALVFPAASVSVTDAATTPSTSPLRLSVVENVPPAEMVTLPFSLGASPQKRHRP